MAAAHGMTGVADGQRLPAANDRVDVAGVELQAVAAPAGALGRDHGRTAAEKAVEYDVAASRTVEDRVSDQRHRFDRWVQCQQIALLTAAGEGIGPGIVPDVAAVAA